MRVLKFSETVRTVEDGRPGVVDVRPDLVGRRPEPIDGCPDAVNGRPEAVGKGSGEGELGVRARWWAPGECLMASGRCQNSCGTCRWVF